MSCNWIRTKLEISRFRAARAGEPREMVGVPSMSSRTSVGRRGPRAPAANRAAGPLRYGQGRQAAPPADPRGVLPVLKRRARKRAGPGCCSPAGPATSAPSPGVGKVFKLALPGPRWTVAPVARPAARPWPVIGRRSGDIIGRWHARAERLCSPGSNSGLAIRAASDPIEKASN